MKHLIRRATALLSAVLLTVSLSDGALAYGHTTSRQEYGSFDAHVDGEQIVLELEGFLPDWYVQDEVLTFRYSDGGSHTYRIKVAGGQAWLMDGWTELNETRGTVRVDGQNYSGALYIPLSLLESRSFTMELADTEMTSEEMGLRAVSVEEPEEPVQTEEPEQPEEPEQTEEPEQPEEAEQTEEPEEPEEPEQTEEPEMPEYTPSPRVSLSSNASGRIVVNGELSDWGGVGAMSHPSTQIGEWKLARDMAGNVYIAYSGTASTEWDYTYTGKMLVIAQNGVTRSCQVRQVDSATWTLGELGNYAVVNLANHNSAAAYGVEAMIPASNFDGEFMIGLGDSADTAVMISSEEIPVLNGQEYREIREETGEAVYNGIVIDGTFRDWDAVSKQNVSALDPNGTLQEAAMVFDGDMVYIYLRETQHTSAGGAGSHSNAKFTLLTDIGYQTMFELHWDSAQVSGVEGAKSSHVGDQWEIAIPKSNLPNYINSINLGLYQGNILVPDVGNRDGSGGGGAFAGIVYDGHYSDWDYYPHHLIQHATAGSQRSVPDGEGALCFSGEDNRIYGHVHTEMPEHLLERGGEYAYDVTFKLNDDENKMLGITLAGVDGAGNIDWSGMYGIIGQLEEGETVELGIFDRDTWHSSSNINELTVPSDRMYGKMYITRTAGREECEFYLDVAALAAKYGMSEKEFREVAAKFGRIGNEWIITSGASSGPWLGVGLSCAAVGGVMLARKRKEGAEAR